MKHKIPSSGRVPRVCGEFPQHQRQQIHGCTKRNRVVNRHENDTRKTTNTVSEVNKLLIASMYWVKGFASIASSILFAQRRGVSLTKNMLRTVKVRDT